MSNYNATKQEIKTYFMARVPLIVVDAAERERVERMLRELAAELTVQIDYYTDARQVEHLGRGGGLNVDSDPLAFAAGEFRKKRGAMIALGDVHRIGEDNLLSRELLNVLYLARESGGTLLVITPDPVWPRLSQFGMLTRLDPPDLEERTDQILRFGQTYGGRVSITWGEEEILRAATLLRGFKEIQIENILSAMLITHGRLEAAHIPELTRQKSRLYGSVPAVEPVYVPKGLQAAGLENLKQWLSEKQRLFFAPEEALEARGLTAPRGILLAGIPGCGKSLSAKMTARLWELPLFRFDIGAVYDKWVGESEKKMKQALTFLDQVAPCVIWIDEIEKGLASTDSSNDTGRRVLGQFLFWLQETPSRIFLVATANDITGLPPELFRKGRFSQNFFVDLPNRAERRAALEQYCRQSLHWLPTDAELGLLVERTRGFSYADIEYVVKELAQQALLYGPGAVSFAALCQGLTAIIPFAQSNPDLVASLRQWGQERAVPASKHETEDRV